VVRRGKCDIWPQVSLWMRDSRGMDTGLFPLQPSLPPSLPPFLPPSLPFSLPPFHPSSLPPSLPPSFPPLHSVRLLGKTAVCTYVRVVQSVDPSTHITTSTSHEETRVWALVEGGREPAREGGREGWGGVGWRCVHFHRSPANGTVPAS
jgi:hypothetical protein